MTPEKPDSTGRFVKSSINHSAVEVDCSTWDAQAGGVLRATGRFVNASLVRPPTTADCTDWRETPADRAEVPEPNDVANGAFPQHDRDVHLVGESVNGLLVVHSTQRELDELEGDQLVEIVRQRGANTILLNLSGVDFVSASFIASLLKVHRQINSGGGRFAICNLSRQVQEVFSLLRLNPMFSIYSNQNQALQAE